MWVGLLTKPLEGGGRKMKISTVGVVSAAILMVVVGVGFGIAQADGDQMDNRAWTLEKWITEYPNDEVAQAREAVETGSLPAESNVVSPIVETEEHHYLGGEDIDDGPKD
jgi:hypothetical protein